MSLTARLVIIAAIVAAAVAGWWRLTAYYEAKGYTRAQTEARELADKQRDRNRELQRIAELRYTVNMQARERVITEIQTEVRYVTQHLASCPLGADGVGLLNRAAECAREDRPASCRTRDGVPNTAPAS